MSPASSTGAPLRLLVPVLVALAGSLAAAGSEPAAATTGAPHVSLVEPWSSTLAGGTPVAIGGHGFSGATAVFFGSVPAASFRVVDDGEIETVAPPADSPGPVDVTVTNASGTSTLDPDDVMSYVAGPALTGASQSVNLDEPGEQVYTWGVGLWGASQVSVGGQAVGGGSLDVQDDRSLSFLSPSEPAAGTYPVSVTTPDGSSTEVETPVPLTYDDSPLVSSVQSYDPSAPGDFAAAQGPLSGGGTFVISGSGLAGATEVLFGSTPASGIGGRLSDETADDSLTGTVPPGLAPGPVDVTVVTPQGRSPIVPGDIWWYGSGSPAPGAPVVQEVESDSGVQGSGPDDGGTLSIFGSGFTDATAVNFGSVSPSSGFTVVSDNELQVQLPRGLEGTVPITVTNPSGTSVPAPGATFTVTTVPVVDNVQLQTSGNSTMATVRGSGLTGVDSVDFAGVASSFVQVLNDSELRAVVPPGVDGGDAVVSTGSLSSAIGPGDVFGFVGALPPQPVLVDRFAVGFVLSGPPTGGGTEGDGICLDVASSGPAITGVDFGSVQATEFDASDPSCGGAASAVVPASGGVSGPVAVTLETSAGPSGYEGAFWFYGPADGSVPLVTEPPGVEFPGESPTIYGSGFSSATSVTVGGVAAQLVVQNDDVATIVLSDDTPLGMQPVVVSSPSGSSPETTDDLVDVLPAAELDFVPPIVPAGALAAESATSGDPYAEAAASSGSLSATASGIGALTVSTYGADPVTSAPVGATGAYGDVAVSSEQSFDSLVVTQCGASSADVLTYWTGSTWQPISPQQFDPSTGCISATLDDSSSTPLISQLSGTPLALGSGGSGASGSGSSGDGNSGGSTSGGTTSGSNGAGTVTVPSSTEAPAVPAAHPASPSHPAPPALSLVRRSYPVVAGRVQIALGCTGSRCSGEVLLRRGSLVLASRRYALEAGHSTRLWLRLNVRAEALLASFSNHRLRAAVIVTVTGGHRLARSVWLQGS